MSQTKIKQRSTEHSHKLEGLNNVLSRLLASRGVTKSQQIDYALNRLLPPNGLSNIADAAHLLSEAIVANANIVIVGDFDADGATSCALAIRCLQSFGLDNVSYLVPNRFEYGYGLTPEIVGVAAIRQPDLIITVDNGISSINGVHAAQQLGMSVLITDHHLPGEEIPTADVIVNPNLENDQFASKNLAGVGVIFYVMLATRAKLRELDWFQQNNITEPNMSQFLDLVALGTVADVVTLDYNNRILVQQGMQRIRQGKACCGIQALLTVGNRNIARLSSSDLGFAVGPRLNAAGRLDDMSVGIECLLADSEDKAMNLALQLDQLNRERRAVEQSMQQDAMAILEKLEFEESESPVIYILHDDNWHQGVVGLVASRIKERTNRPVLAFAPSDTEEEYKGSARSVGGLHIRDILARVDSLFPNLITKFGGHAMAAGLSLPKANLARFKSALIQVTEEITQGRNWDQVLLSDGELSDDEFSMDFAEQIRQISPWGQGFPEPLFDGKFQVIDAKVVGETHAKLKLRPLHSNQYIDAICFGYLNARDDLPQGEIRAVFRLDVNEFRDRKNLQLMIQFID
ncbi:MAG: single-stranded-DNA-specific exonuclease RecJ [Acidiferrobacterales bacterium]|nr:single-stranded-DNA-specific exonuclease RecJ [Acidiferrobacterales bacterium]